MFSEESISRPEFGLQVATLQFLAARSLESDPIGMALTLTLSMTAGVSSFNRAMSRCRLPLAAMQNPDEIF